MPTSTPEDFPHHSLRYYWPNEFSIKRRRFNRPDENHSYIEKWLLASFDDCGGDDDDTGESEDDGDVQDNFDDSIETEDEDDGHIDKTKDTDQRRNDDRGAEDCKGHNSVRLFVAGMVGDEDALQFRDQVEQVAGFCEQSGCRKVEDKVALLDDRNNLVKSGSCRPYKGPLTSKQLREELSQKRFRAGSEQNSLTNAYSGDGSDVDRRVIFITDLDASAIEALATTAPRSQAAALKDLFYKHLTSKTSIAVTIPSQGFRVFALDFHFSYYVLREDAELLEDSRKKFDGKPLRQSWKLPFLSGPMSASISTDKFHCLYEVQMSIAVTGIDDWVWTAIGLFDAYFGSKESADGYHELKGRTGRPDPLAAGQIAANNPIWNPREYFLKVLEIRINEVRREWHVIIDKVEGDIKQSRTNNVFPLFSSDSKTRQEVREFSMWSTQMVGLLRRLRTRLSDMVGTWDKFQRKEIGYFLYDGASSTAASSLKPSLDAVDNAFWDLKDLLRKLRDLERELCEDNPQGLNAHLSFGNHEAAIFQQKTARHIYFLTVITIVFFPLVMATAIFSTQGVLPFTPNLARFTYVLIILVVLVAVTLVVSFNWDSWFQPLAEYVTALRNAPIYSHEQPARDEIRDESFSTLTSIRKFSFRRSKKGSDPETGTYGRE